MFDTSWIDDLDREATLVAAAENVQVRLEADAAQMRLAAHWADLYSADAAEGREAFLEKRQPKFTGS